MYKLKELVTVFICDWFHKGGRIKRDIKGRINWQCDTCGKWADSPVLTEHEKQVIDFYIEEKLRKRSKSTA